MQMDFLHDLRWLWVIIGMIIVCLVISFIFILINKCLFKRGKHRFQKFRRNRAAHAESNNYDERNTADNTPPLPPRTQFLIPESPSYENLADGPDLQRYEQKVPKYHQNLAAVPDDTNEQDDHDYEEAQDVEPVAKYQQNLAVVPDDTYEQDDHDYEEAQDVEPVAKYQQNLAAVPDDTYEQDDHDYEQAQDLVPDYVDLDQNESVFPPPKEHCNHASDSASMDYDDIDEDCDMDYDDVV